MNVRAVLEKRLIDWADAQGIPVAVENVAFDKPEDMQAYFEIDFLTSATVNPTLDCSREREVGIMQITICVKDGTGSGIVDEFVDSVKLLYPVLPKTDDVSIERPVKRYKGMAVDGWYKTPLDISYRQER